MKKLTLSILTLIYALNGFSQNSWTLSMTGYDQTYSPADFVTASNGDVYVNGVKYDNGISGFINKLYKSTNQGSSWTEVSTTGLTNLGNVHSLTISGNKMILGGMDVVSANGAKIYISTDNGANWTLSMTGYDQTYSPTDFVTASNGDVYVNGVKYDNGISGFINKLYKSTNQGSSWTEVSTTGLTNLGNVHSLTISGNKMILGGMDVVSANGAKIYISTDNGANWTLSMTGYDQTYSPTDFVTASNGDVYVNGVKYDNGISGFINKLYKSTNQGSSWTEVSTTGLTNLGNVHSLTISGNKMILGGMDVNSTNGAKIFTSTYSNPTTGIGENIITKNAKVFPNPFTDKIIIDFTYESNNETKSIKLFSITGELISQISITNNPSNQLELNNLSSGVYMLVITSGSEIQTIKLVKE